MVTKVKEENFRNKLHIGSAFLSELITIKNALNKFINKNFIICDSTFVL